MDKWLKSGKYLPLPIRDFHEQKDVFKAIHDTVNVQGICGKHPVDWISGQYYVIDVFLWYMARRGYVLQKSRRKTADFRDLEADVKACKDARNAAFFAALNPATQPQDSAIRQGGAG